MKIIKYFLLLFVASAASAQIHAYPGSSGGGSCITPSGSTQCDFPASPTLNINVGDTLVVMQSISNNSSGVTLSGCNQTWPAPIVINTGSTWGMRVWVILHAAAAATACQVRASGWSGAVNAITMQIYSGVQSVGTPVTNTTATSGATTLHAPTITAAQAGNYIVGFFFATTMNILPTVGVPPTTYRRGQSNQSQAVSVVMADIAATSTGQQATVTVTPNVAQTYRSAAIELISAPTNHTALAEEAMHTVLMRPSRSMSYILPAAGLSPAWCNWFMPTGSDANTYALEPETTRQLNGQNNPIRIPSWQMSRICQDEYGSYWASPPLRAGHGIAITGSATGVEITSTGAAGDMAYIAGGTSHIPTGSIAANDCSTLLTTTASSTPSAEGVLPTDIVSWSMQTGAATTGFAQVTLRTVPGNDQIQWRFCNAGTTAYSPTARDINWYVARRTISPVAARRKPAVHHKPVVHHKPARAKK